MRSVQCAAVSLVLLAALGSAQERNLNRLGESYLIRSGDELQIIVAGEPELSGWVCVRADGMITFPLVGSIPAAGRTIRELRANLTKELARFVKAPHLKVQMSGKEVPVGPGKWLTPPEHPVPFALPEPSYRS